MKRDKVPMALEPVVVTWDSKMLERFKVTTRKNDQSKAESFKFDGNEFLVDYAKYLIEYLDPMLKP